MASCKRDLYKHIHTYSLLKNEATLDGGKKTCLAVIMQITFAKYIIWECKWEQLTILQLLSSQLCKTCPCFFLLIMFLIAESGNNAAESDSVCNLHSLISLNKLQPPSRFSENIRSFAVETTESRRLTNADPKKIVFMIQFPRWMKKRVAIKKKYFPHSTANKQLTYKHPNSSCSQCSDGPPVRHDAH